MFFEKYLEVLETTLFSIKSQKLTVLEREILKAAWDNYSYKQVADNSYLTVGHIKDVASKLWKKLSEILGEKVTKANLRLVLEKKNFVASNTYPLPDNSEIISTEDVAFKDYISQLQQENHQLKQSKEILYQSNTFLESILNTSFHGIAAIQAVRDRITGEITNFRFLMANPVIAKFFYSNQEDLIGDYLLNTKIFLDNPGLFDSLVEVVETRKPFNQELYYEINGNQNWYQIIAVILGDGITLTIRDITQTKLLELELTP